MATVPMYIRRTSGGQAEQDEFPSSLINLKSIEMKRIKTIGLVIIAFMIISGCEEAKDPAGRRNAAVVPVISDINPGIFDSKDLQNSYVEFVIDLVPGTQVDKVVVVGSYQDNLERIEMTNVTTFPSTVRIQSADAAQKLGIALDDIQNGDVFLFELLAVADGMTTRSNAILRVSVACAFDGALATGSYHSVCPEWPSEGNITITADPEDPYTLYVVGLAAIEGLDEDQGPLVMHIDPATFAVTADPAVIASDYFGYGPISYVGDGVYSSCDGSYTMYFDIAVGGYGSQGIFRFDFTRNP